ncbi:MAG: glycosyltransferase family 39 protein [Patescibacteria group bacterium]|nr:glycosyltransferase family 39 protein [Patescibacteria group bacterium]
MNWFEKNKEITILAVVGVVFFLVYSFLPLAQMTQSPVPMSEVSMRFNTPDEVTNNYFTNLYADSGQMFYKEPLNLLVGGIIFPRWARTIDEKITPGTFQGIILIYGNIAKIIGRATIPFLTPFFAALGVIFFYLLVKEFWEKNVAFVSALLMFIFPGFWYYASRTMFHNVLFLVCLIIGLFFLVKLIKSNKDSEDAEERGILRGRTRKFLISIFCGLFFGLALITRTSEVVWMVLIVLILLTVLKPKIKEFWPYALISIVICALCFLPILHNNKIFYGSYFSFGYSSTVTTDLEDVSSARPIGLVQALLLPFGFHPIIIAKVFYNYILKLFWPWLILWLAGLIWFWKSKPNKEQKLFIISSLVVSCWLIVYYGSWKFSDNLAGFTSIGSSYVRYFLPAFVLGLPLVAWGIVELSNKINKFDKINKKIVFCLLLIVICLLPCFSYRQVFWSGPEALMGVKNSLLSYREQAADVLKITKENDIILVDVSQDKIIFPERKHIIVPQGGGELKPVKALLEITNVWFFYRSAEANPDFLNEKKFKPYGLEIYDGKELNGGGMIFKVKEFERKLGVSS